jgi:uncharacterized membrane-anchored protein
MEELTRALLEAPSWELVLGQVKSLARVSIERGDFAAARKAAEVLLRTEGQKHAGLYFSALIALRTGDAEGARRLARAALESKPDHRASLELLEELGEKVGPKPGGAAPPR